MIGKALKYMRNSINLNQENMSKLINIGRTTLSDYEREKTDINFYTLENLANKCGYKIYFINEKTKDKFQIKDLARKDI